MAPPIQCGQMSNPNSGQDRKHHRYELYGEELEHVFEETDIGVTIDHKLRIIYRRRLEKQTQLLV